MIRCWRYIFIWGKGILLFLGNLHELMSVGR